MDVYSILYPQYGNNRFWPIKWMTIQTSREPMDAMHGFFDCQTKLPVEFVKQSEGFSADSERWFGIPGLLAAFFARKPAKVMLVASDLMPLPDHHVRICSRCFNIFIMVGAEDICIYLLRLGDVKETGHVTDMNFVVRKHGENMDKSIEPVQI